MNKTSTIAIVALISSAFGAFASDFESGVSVNFNNWTIGLSHEGDDFAKARIGYTYLKKEHENGWRSKFYSGLEYDFEMDRTKFVNDFRASKNIAKQTSFYANLSADYIFANKGDDSLIIAPTLGLAYSFNDRASVYVDFTPSFDTLDNFDYIGSEVGGGLSAGLNETTWFTVGFTRNINTEWEEKNDFYAVVSMNF